MTEVSAQLVDVSIEHLVSASAGDSYLGCAVSCADFNGDGWDDLTLSEDNGNISLYTGGQNGFELFVQLPGQGNDGRGVLWVDVDNDGDLDLWALRALGPIELYIQDELGGMTNEAESRGLSLIPDFNPRGISASDYDRDGDVDVYIATYLAALSTNDSLTNLLFQNDGAGHFSDVSMESGLDNGVQTSFQGSWLDYNADGWPDLWLINDRQNFLNALYENQGDGTFIDVAPDLGLDFSGSPMSATVFDPDRDGDWDLFSSHVDNWTNQLWECTEAGYLNVSSPAGVGGLMDYGWGGCVIDIQGDGLEDLLVATNHWPSQGPSDNRMYVNTGAGMLFFESFGWPNEQYPLYNLGRLDINGDGVPDIAGYGALPTVQLLQNESGSGANWLTLNLVGTSSNAFAIGAIIKVYSGGNMQMQQVDAGADYQTQHSYTRFFGLGGSVGADSIVVKWPTGQTETWTEVLSGTHTLVEGTQNAALTPLSEGCPWDAQQWLVPFSPDLFDMTWNGQVVLSDTVTAEQSGSYELVATFWNGQDTWTSSVVANVMEEPEFTLQVDSAQCPWETAEVQWAVSLPGDVEVNGELQGSEGQMSWAVSDSVHWTWEHQSGCFLDSTFVVHVPDAVDVTWSISVPPCAGEPGQVQWNVEGGTPPWSADWMNEDPEALDSGTHHVVMMDAIGCSLQDSVIIELPSVLESAVEWSYIGTSDTAQVAITAVGGTPPYDVQWAGGLGEGLLIAPGFVSWLLEDVQGCNDFGLVEVPGNPLTVVGFQERSSVEPIREGSSIRWSNALDEAVRLKVLDLAGRLLWIEMGPLEPIHLPVSGSPVVIQVEFSDGTSAQWVR